MRSPVQHHWDAAGRGAMEGLSLKDRKLRREKIWKPRLTTLSLRATGEKRDF